MDIRSANMPDVNEITKLLEAYDLHTAGEIETTEADTQQILSAVPNMETHTWVVRDGGKIIGFAAVTESSGSTYPSLVLAHPEHLHKGIEDELMEKMSQSIMEGTLTVSSNNDYEHGLFAENGFKPVRHWFNMKIDLRQKSPSGDMILPSGYKIEPFRLNQDEEDTFRAFEESFQTHFDYNPSTLEDFLKRTNREGFDPELWLLLKENDSIAGFIFCKRSTEQHAEITHVGIRPAWRKKGLGRTLLYHAFHVLFNEGRPVIDLNVDSKNGTGAVKVYESVGMKINRHFIRYDKKIEKN
jgi:mycothiol synthase